MPGRWRSRSGRAGELRVAEEYDGLLVPRPRMPDCVAQVGHGLKAAPSSPSIGSRSISCGLPAYNPARNSVRRRIGRSRRTAAAGLGSNLDKAVAVRLASREVDGSRQPDGHARAGSGIGEPERRIGAAEFIDGCTGLIRIRPVVDDIAVEAIKAVERRVRFARPEIGSDDSQLDEIHGAFRVVEGHLEDRCRIECVDAIEDLLLRPCGGRSQRDAKNGMQRARDARRLRLA